MNIGNTLDNRYEIRDIKKGGLGIVYIAYDSEWKKLVAIKTFQNAGSFSQEIKNRFITEATNWINIGYHENIVLAHYYNTISNIPYLFMEFVNGYTLRTMVNKEYPLSALVAHAIEVCTALQHVYDKFKLIHRDIKPDNIFVTMERAEQFNIAKVTDFGLSKVLIPDSIIENPEVLVSLQKQSLYTTQSILGTLFYVSPEQILGDTNIDCRSDIYSFGIMLYELVTHRLPFYPDSNVNSTQNLLYKHLNTKPPEPIGLNSSIPHSLNKIILKCLEKKKEKRFDNYSVLIDELKKVYASIKSPNVTTSQDFFECQLQPIYSETVLLNNKACSYLALGNYPEAIVIFDKILKKAPNDIYALCNKANVLMRLERYDESISLLKKALKIDTSDAEIWGLLGIVYNRTGKHNNALECCNKALGLDAGNPQYIKDKAFVLKDLGRFDEAISLFKKVTEIKPDDSTARHELSVLYERDGQQKKQKD
jgi:serine/threonine protein kinase